MPWVPVWDVSNSATTDPTRDRTERFTCLRFHPGMLHEKSHLKCPIGHSVVISDGIWTRSMRSHRRRRPLKSPSGEVGLPPTACPYPHDTTNRHRHRIQRKRRSHNAIDTTTPPLCRVGWWCARTVHRRTTVSGSQLSEDLAAVVAVRRRHRRLPVDAERVEQVPQIRQQIRRGRLDFLGQAGVAQMLGVGDQRPRGPPGANVVVALRVSALPCQRRSAWAVR